MGKLTETFLAVHVRTVKGVEVTDLQMDAFEVWGTAGLEYGLQEILANQRGSPFVTEPLRVARASVPFGWFLCYWACLVMTLGQVVGRAVAAVAAATPAGKLTLVDRAIQHQAPAARVDGARVRMLRAAPRNGGPRPGTPGLLGWGA
jgi:hypothetical protein